MHRERCAALTLILALTGATSVAASATPDHATAGAAEDNLRCTTQLASHRFVRGSDDFDTAMDFLVANGAFPSGAAKLVMPRTAAAIEVDVDLPTACGTPTGASTATACAAADCGDTPFSPADFAPGTRLAMQTCADGVHTDMRWLAGKDGWMLTRAAQELVPQCESPG